MNNYIPQKQDIIWIDFNPSKGKEIQKRRPALVISSDNYNKQTGFVAVCPITHGQQKLKAKGLLVEVQSKAEKITILDDFAFAQVVQLNRFIFE